MYPGQYLAAAHLSGTFAIVAGTPLVDACRRVSLDDSASDQRDWAATAV